MSTKRDALLEARGSIRQVLRGVLAGSIECKMHGLCWHIHRAAQEYPVQIVLADWLGATFRTWPKFSGMLDYPVPSCRRQPNAEYRLAQWGHKNMYDKRTVYGRNRLDLAQYLLDNLDKFGGLNGHED